MKIRVLWANIGVLEVKTGENRCFGPNIAQILLILILILVFFLNAFELFFMEKQILFSGERELFFLKLEINYYPLKPEAERILEHTTPK